jgi:hypothetical protein
LLPALFDDEFFADSETLLPLAGGLLPAEFGILGSIPPPYVTFRFKTGSSSDVLFRVSTGFFRNLIS